MNLINYLWPLLIVLLAAPIRGMRLGPARLAGVGLGFAGCALIVGPGASFPPDATIGFLAAAGAAVVWAVYSVTAGTPRLSRVPTEAVAGFCLATAALAALLHAVFETTVAPSGGEWLAVLGLGLGPVGAAFFLWDLGMKRGDPRLLGTLAYAVPVASTLLLILAGEGAMSPRVRRRDADRRRRLHRGKGYGVEEALGSWPPARRLVHRFWYLPEFGALQLLGR